MARFVRDAARNQQAAALRQRMLGCQTLGDERGWSAARRALVEMFEPLSFSVVRRFLGHELFSPDDIRQECRLALLQAIDRWDPGRGEFPVLLYYFLRRAMAEYIRNWELIRRGGTDFIRHGHARRRGEAGTETAPLTVRSLTGDSEEEQDLVERVGTADPHYEQAELRLLIDQALASLPAEHRECVVLHYGLEGRRPHTYREIAARIGMSRQHAKNRVDQALPLLARGLQGV